MTTHVSRNHEPTVAAVTVAVRFCEHCGDTLGSTDSGESLTLQESDGTHPDCVGRLAMEPPRYCAECGRRMKVQVVPRRWMAECSRHGQIA